MNRNERRNELEFKDGTNFSNETKTELNGRSVRLECKFLPDGEGARHLIESLGSCEAYFLWNIALQAIEKLHAVASQLGAENEKLFCEVEKLMNDFNKLESRVRRDTITCALSWLAFDMDKEIFKENPPYTILFVDVNGLKQVNDTFGHHVGDLYLKKVAELLKSACRATDRLYRVGGDEFVIIIRGKTNAEIIKKRILRKMQEVYSILGIPEDKRDEIRLGVSVGFSYYDGKTSFIEALKQADKNMYEDKKRQKRELEREVENRTL